MSVSFDTMMKFLPQIVKNMPDSWRGTTFKNHNLLGREQFSKDLCKLVASKAASGGSISSADLVAVGNAEDYFRVSSNISTTLELVLALRQKCSVDQIFTFASTTMALVAVLFTAKDKPVHLYLGDEKSPFSIEQDNLLRIMGCDLICHAGAPKARPSSDIVLAVESVAGPSFVDAVVVPNMLLINNTNAVSPDDVLVIRKRMATPITTPAAETLLQQMCGLPVTTGISMPSSVDLNTFNAHLQTLCGTPVNPAANPVVFTAGLPALASLYMSMISRGGVDVVMCSTAYGGSSQLTDILTSKTKLFKKHTFDIQGALDMASSIESKFADLAKNAANMLPTTLLFVEIPTNPDMKVPDLEKITSILKKYKQSTGKKAMLMVDVTFAPGSQIMGRVQKIDPELGVLIFISMSKSVSRGLTTAGTIIANHTDEAVGLLKSCGAVASMMDTVAKPDQLQRLTANHVGVEQRCQKAYGTAVAVADALRGAVRKYANYDMPLAFVSPDQAAVGYTTSTFSFNLPPPKGATPAINAALAQRFVDLLTAHKEFKPCVSFGQDNGLVYATVPATSTQGAIKEEDKAKQAVGGVQLTRLSFPPTPDRSAVVRIIVDSVAALYSGSRL